MNQTGLLTAVIIGGALSLVLTITLGILWWICPVWRITEWRAMTRSRQETAFLRARVADSGRIQSTSLIHTRPALTFHSRVRAMSQLYTRRRGSSAVLSLAPHVEAATEERGLTLELEEERSPLEAGAAKAPVLSLAPSPPALPDSACSARAARLARFAAPSAAGVLLVPFGSAPPPPTPSASGSSMVRGLTIQVHPRRSTPGPHVEDRAPPSLQRPPPPCLATGKTGPELRRGACWRPCGRCE